MKRHPFFWNILRAAGRVRAAQPVTRPAPIFSAGPRRWPVMGLLLLVALAAGCASRPNPRVMFTETRVNGQEVRLALDTCASTTVLFSHAATRLKLATTPPPRGLPHTRGRVSFDLSEPLQLEVGGARLAVSLPVLKAPNIGLDGVIGWPEVRDNVLYMDAQTRQVRGLEAVPEDVKGWIAFKIRPDEFLRLEAPGSDGKATILIDAGDSDGGVALPQEQFALWKKAHPHAPWHLGGVWFPATGASIQQVFWADKHTIGPLTLTDLPVEGSPSADNFEVPILGLYALSRTDLVLDGPGKMAYFRPRPPPGPAFPDFHRTGVSDDKASLAAATADWSVAGNVKVATDPLLLFSGGFRCMEGNFAAALADLDRLVGSPTAPAEAWFKRGLVKQGLGDLPGALADYDASIARASEDPYPHIFRQLLRLRMGMPAGDFARTAGGWKDEWEKSVGLYAAGMLGESDLLKRAKAGGGDEVKDRLSLAYYAMAATRLAKGDTAGAREYLKQCVAQEQVENFEYAIAQAEAKVLNAGNTKGRP